MSNYRRFEDIEVWQTARELTRVFYRLSREGEFAHDYELRGQMRRSAVSVMSNIAEGFESRTQGLFIDYLGRAKGSCGEFRSQLYVALDAGYIVQDQFDSLYSLAESCSRQLNGLTAYLEAHPSARRIREDGVEYAV